MTTRTGQALPKDDRTEEPVRTARSVVTPPPLAPELPRRVPRVLSLATVIAILMMAGLAQLSGAPHYIALGLILIAMVGMVLVWRALRMERRAQSILSETSARSLAEIETLADRMGELQESEERLRGLIDALGDLVVHRDSEGRITYANRVFADLVGLDQRDLVGRSLAALGMEVGLVPESAFAEGECLSSTDVAFRVDAGTRWYSWIELSVRDKASGLVSHRAIARDITDRKRAEMALISARERAEFASQAKSRFLATVSHEIRTPMNGIMGMAKLLADTALSPEQRTYVGAVSTSAAALLALIEDLLDYSKIEAGRFEAEPQPMSPVEIADNVVELLAAKAYAKGIGLGCHVEPEVPQLVTADPGRVRQVLLNLIGNAIKFTDTGGVMLTVSRRGTGRSASVRFAVTDTGTGVGAEHLDRIFEEFEQGDNTSTRTHGGAGLGLAISRRLVASMGGTIGATSTPAKGSEFAFEIPATGAVEAARRPGTVLAGHRAVIVSTNRVEAEAIARTIRAHGGRCDIAATPEEARPFAMGCATLLVDAAGEEGDGRLLTRLRQAGFGASEAITLIAPTDRGKLGEFRANGYTTFLARPVRGETLLRVLIAGFAGQPAADTPPRIAPGASHRGHVRQPGLSVLVAEDNDINALLAKAALAKAGHRVEVVGNGRAAVEALTSAARHRQYDLVLMDLHMPVMDGLDAIAAIRRFEEGAGLAPIPIMVLSADSQETTRHTVLAHGANGFLTKPLDPDQLLRTVQEQAAAA